MKIHLNISNLEECGTAGQSAEDEDDENNGIIGHTEDSGYVPNNDFF